MNKIDWSNTDIVMHPLNATKQIDTSYLITGYVTDGITEEPEMLSVATLNIKKSNVPFARLQRAINMFGLVFGTKTINPETERPYAYNELPAQLLAEKIKLSQYLHTTNKYVTSDGKAIDEIVYYKKTAFEAANIDVGANKETEFKLLFHKDDDPKLIFRECIYSRIGIPFPQELSDVVYDYITIHKFKPYPEVCLTSTIEDQVKDDVNFAVEFRPCFVNYGNTIGYKIRYNYKGLVGLVSDLIKTGKFKFDKEKT